MADYELLQALVPRAMVRFALSFHVARRAKRTAFSHDGTDCGPSWLRQLTEGRRD
jgi:hypothetical protein